MPFSGKQTYRLSLERAPDDGTVADSELGQATSWKDSSFRDIESIHYRDDIITSSACAFDILQELASHQLMHILTEVRRVERNASLKVIKKKHRDGCSINAIIRIFFG